jgi:hypothetical protein
MILKQSTAVDVLIGPFVDLTDGATAETGESPTVKLSKNGQALAAKNDVTTPVHDADGYYNCELDATDTNTVGTMILTVAASASALPVRHEFQVIEEAIYDDLYGASAAGYGDATAASIAALNDISPAEVNAQCDTAISDASLATSSALATVDSNVDAILVDTGTTIPAQITGLNDLSAADVNAEVDTALTDIHLDHIFATDYDPASKPGSATALFNELVENDSGVSRFTVNALENGPSGSGASAAAIADAVWTETLADHSGTAGSTAEALDGAGGGGGGLDAAGVRAAVGLASANLDTQLSTIDSNVDAVLVDTGTAIPATISTIDANVDAILVDTGTSIPATLSGLNDLSAAEVNAEVDTALSDYDAPTKAELDAGFAALNDLSAAEVNSEVDTAISDAALATASSLAVVDAGMDAILIDTGVTIPAQISGLNNISVAEVNAEVDSALSDAALATAAALATVDSNVDSVKTKTDSLNFGVSGKVDANITHVNEVEVAGDGQLGTEWGPA